MKIAIIGGGVSGLVSAYLLAPHHDIMLYEKADRIGGHAHTLNIKEGQHNIAVDNGFMVFNPAMYPNFVGLLKELGISSNETTMSFGVHIPDEISYRGDIPYGLFADKSNLFRPRFWKFLLQIIKFRKVAKKVLSEKNDNNETLGKFLKKHKFSPDLANWFLYPMLAAIWSIQETDRVEDFPAKSTFVFLNNHRLLDNSRLKWRTISGGSIEYVSCIQAVLKKHKAKIILNANINSVKRGKNKVSVTNNGKVARYDYAIFATHADTTKQLLADITTEESSALGKFKYTTSRTILHKDTSFLPSNQKLLAAWNYTQNTKYARKPVATFTYCMNILQHIPNDTPVFVSLNPLVPIDQNKIYAQEIYTHPQYNNDSLVGQKQISDIQGKNRTIYTGAHLGYGFHEDGIESAVAAAKILGITPSWQTKR
ncbi:MAG: FAD-dependent oxidoreductase [Candidatus Saccharibacteria bacterium]|nr:FAD-dependent oxidoreductase [Candidatus Saccharibacteria bacterium]